MDPWSAIADIVILFVAAFVLGAIFERFGQNAILGYLCAGLILGPGAIGAIDDPQVIRGAAELGVVLLLFSIGLEFSVSRLIALGRVALVGGTLQIVATVVVVGLIARSLGQSWPAAFGLGMVVAPSSTAVVMRVMHQRSELDSIHGRAGIGILLMQDVALVPLVMGVTLLGGGGGDGAMVPNLLQSFGWGAGLFVIFFLMTRYVLPFVIDRAVVLRNRELPVLLAVSMCIVSAWSAHALGLSPVLGAFGAGILLAESPFATWIQADIRALRTLFITLFFTSVAMVDDFSWIGREWHRLLLLVPAILAGKAAVILLVVRVCGVPFKHALATGLCLSQMGEFSFVLAEVGHGTHLFGVEMWRIMVTSTVVTLIATPFLIGWGGRVSRRRGSTLLGVLRGAEAQVSPSDHVIIVGFGPSGRAFYDSVREQMEAAIIDMNPRARQTVDPAPALFITGDASHEAVLEHAGIHRARAVAITIPDHRAALEISRHARALAPECRILVRARYHRYLSELRGASDDIADEEWLTGKVLAGKLLEAK